MSSKHLCSDDRSVLIPSAPELDDSKADAGPGLRASARRIGDRTDQDAALLDREAMERSILLMHIERYVASPFGFFPSLL
jgi:hypothetical protein